MSPQTPRSPCIKSAGSNALNVLPPTSTGQLSSDTINHMQVCSILMSSWAPPLPLGFLRRWHPEVVWHHHSFWCWDWPQPSVVLPPQPGCPQLPPHGARSNLIPRKYALTWAGLLFQSIQVFYDHRMEAHTALPESIHRSSHFGCGPVAALVQNGMNPLIFLLNSKP